MPSNADRLNLALMALALAAPAAAQQPAVPTGPDGAPPPGGIQGSSGETRYDEVGYAARVGQAGERAYAVLSALPVGSFVEVTALVNGKTILLEVTGPHAGPGLVGLSGAAGRALGFDGNNSTGVRVRQVLPPAPDVAAVRAGNPPARLDSPEALLIALRRRLPGGGQTVVDPAAAAPPANRGPGASYAPPGRAAAPAAPARGGRFLVQVAAFSDRGRAAALAQSLGGMVRSAGGIHRVQLGPYADAATAQRARAGVAARGHGDARVISQ